MGNNKTAVIMRERRYYCAAPGRTLSNAQPLRRRPLYPAELRDHKGLRGVGFGLTTVLTTKRDFFQFFGFGFIA